MTVFTVGSQRPICRKVLRPRRCLANLAAFGLDRRLSALAIAAGAITRATPTTSTFSGGKRLLAGAQPFRALVAEIVEDEGFRLNRRKSRLTTRAGCQTVTGIVVNEHPNPGRRKYDALRATLRDAALRGPTQANRAGLPEFRAHLLGRIGWLSRSSTPLAETGYRRVFASIEW